MLTQVLRACPSEAYFWTIALVGVASIDPAGPPLLNLCLFENVGLPCPGDGLGQSIAYLVRGQFAASWNSHPLAGPVVGVLVYHIGGLVHSAQVRAQGRGAESSFNRHPPPCPKFSNTSPSLKATSRSKWPAFSTK